MILKKWSVVTNGGGARRKMSG